MKNKTVKMVLAVVVLGVCCGAYAGVKTYVAHQEQKESEEDSEESTTVFTASTDNIKSLDFMVDDTETTFEKDDDSWVKKDETDFPVNQTTLDSAASAIASVDSDRVLEDVDDLSEYGLDSPSNTIKIVTKSDEEDGDDITTTLYVGDEKCSVLRPVKELKAFQKITLAPGEKKEVTFTITPDDLKFYDEAVDGWTAEPGKFKAYIGASSADIRGTVPFELK